MNLLQPTNISAQHKPQGHYRVNYYDSLGRMLTAAKVVDSNTISKTEFVYSDIGRITDANETLFGGSTKTIQYTYDQAGLLTSTTYPYSSVVINITPDWQGRIDTLKLNTATMVTYQYIGSRVAKRSYYHNLVNYANYEPTYDNLSRVTTHRSYNTGADITKFDYEYAENTNNISRQTYDHRSGDPHTDFSYDNLDRLTIAQYGIQDNNEVFTMDELGNRTNVNIRDGNDVTYSVDNLTNRYNTVGGDSLSYDAAGNLTKDKDGYEYEYDYENRIVKITKDSNDIAEFAYDALGRRVEKKDLVDPNNTRRYYYNNNWQVLCEYNSSDEFQRWFAYGNYIDEVLIMSTSYAPPVARFYIHDHLYSPAALLLFNGAVLERYEYDAYGACQILEPNFAPDPDQKSDYANPYLFQGKRLDLLDNGGLELMTWPYRNYLPDIGRWTQPEKLGMIPNDNQGINPFDVLKQYEDGMNLYQALASNPVRELDIYGLLCAFREYKENLWLDDNLLPHAGLLLGLHEDIDFGPAGFPWVISPGECPFKGGGVSWGIIETWELEIKKTPEEIKYGHPDRPLCCCATCGDVGKCVRKTCQEWNEKWFILGIQDCWSFVSAAKENCCLEGGN